MDYEEVVRRRKMVRNYTGDPVDGGKISRILDQARRAPSAGFSQGQSFVVITDIEMRGRIATLAGEEYYVASGMPRWISNAPVLVVLCVSEQIYRDRYAEPDKHGVASDSEWPVPWWYVDAGCSMMLLLLGATNEGLAAGFCGPRDSQSVRELLGIPDHVMPIGLVTIGHPAPDQRSSSLARGWKPVEQVIHHERWGNQTS